MRNYFIIAFFLIPCFTFSQQVEKATYGTVALVNAKIETVTKGTIENGIVIIKDGLIAAVGSNIPVPADASRIDCSNQTIYPGFIDSGTRLGLQEIGSISVTHDYDEIGDMNPEMEALTAVNPNSVLIPVTRVSGVTTVIAAPQGNLFSGSAALIDLQGYTPEQMFAGFEGTVLQFPVKAKRSRWDRRSEEEIKKEYDKSIKRLNDIWSRVGEYARIDSLTSGDANYNPQYQALVPAYKGKSTMLIEVNQATDIIEALKWIKTNNVKAVLTGVSEGWRVADSIRIAGVSVITGPILAEPTRESDRYDQAYKNAGLMHQAGVKVALRTSEAENVRNLPFNAGFAAAYGLGKEEALKAITIIPAEIFGVSDHVGSIEVGKKANLFVSDGDPFEPATKINHLFIQGWDVPIESRHSLLYDEFLNRTPGATPPASGRP